MGIKEKKRKEESGREKRRPEHMNGICHGHPECCILFNQGCCCPGGIQQSHRSYVVFLLFLSNLRFEILIQIKELNIIQEKFLHLPLVHMHRSSISLPAVNSYLLLSSTFLLD